MKTKITCEHCGGSFKAPQGLANHLRAIMRRETNGNEKPIPVHLKIALEQLDQARAAVATAMAAFVN